MYDTLLVCNFVYALSAYDVYFVQDSLGGSAYSCMIVNIAPEERYYLDTIATLKLARKSKKIVNTVIVHEDVVSKL